MDKETLPPKDLEKTQVDPDDLRHSIEIMEECGFDCENLKLIAKAVYLYEQTNIPFNIFLSSDRMWIEVLDQKATKH